METIVAQEDHINNEMLSKELVEQILAMHYTDAREFTWSNIGVNFIHNGIINQQNYAVLSNENKMFRDQIIHMNGVVDGLSQAMRQMYN